MLWLLLVNVGKRTLVTYWLIPDQAARGDTVLVRHYTDTATRQLINESGQLRAGTFVTLPSEITPRAGHLQIERILEINLGRGATYIISMSPHQFRIFVFLPMARRRAVALGSGS